MMSSTRFDLVANAIPGVEELTCITQRNSRTAIRLRERLGLAPLRGLGAKISYF